MIPLVPPHSKGRGARLSPGSSAGGVSTHRGGCRSCGRCGGCKPVSRNKRWLAKGTITLALALGWGCQYTFSAAAADATSFYPPSEYVDIWYDMVECTDFPFTRVEYRDVRWYRTPDYCVYNPDHRTNDGCAAGLAWVQDNIIVLPDRSIGHVTVIRHEVIHLLSGQRHHEGNYWECVSWNAPGLTTGG